MVERYIVAIKMRVQFPSFTLKFNPHGGMVDAPDLNLVLMV